MINTSNPHPFPKEPPLPPIGSTYRGSSIVQRASSIVQRAASVTQTRDSTTDLQQLQPTTAVPSMVDDSVLTGKLINVEAQRIMSVLQEAQRKVLVMGLLPDEVDRRVSNVFAAETVALIGVSLYFFL
ncbi:hypothetical protein HDU98_010015 [Podochytrium sp. JEL0797]|nr:hypothetical protein HDU98_010015 [Podochytrium sp. JEL0797]